MTTIRITEGKNFVNILYIQGDEEVASFRLNTAHSVDSMIELLRRSRKKAFGPVEMEEKTYSNVASEAEQKAWDDDLFRKRIEPVNPYDAVISRLENIEAMINAMAHRMEDVFASIEPIRVDFNPPTLRAWANDGVTHELVRLKIDNLSEELCRISRSGLPYGKWPISSIVTKLFDVIQCQQVLINRLANRTEGLEERLEDLRKCLKVEEEEK